MDVPYIQMRELVGYIIESIVDYSQTVPAVRLECVLESSGVSAECKHKKREDKG